MNVWMRDRVFDIGYWGTLLFIIYSCVSTWWALPLWAQITIICGVVLVIIEVYEMVKFDIPD